jgi:hypothetical protein
MEIRPPFATICEFSAMADSARAKPLRCRLDFSGILPKSKADENFEVFSPSVGALKNIDLPKAHRR